MIELIRLDDELYEADARDMNLWEVGWDLLELSKNLPLLYQSQELDGFCSRKF